MSAGDIVGIAKATRGNTGEDWLEAKILGPAAGGFYDFEVEYKDPPPGGKYRRVSKAHCVPYH